MVSNQFSRADVLYRKIARNTFFRHGWGSIETYRGLQRLKKDIFNREKFKEIVLSETVKIDKLNEVSSKHDAFSVLEGHFFSPLAKFYPGLLPKESEIAQFQAIVPKRRRSDDKLPMCIQLAGTGDHHFWRRRNLVAKPLLKESSVGSILLVNPYYGCRKPEVQSGSSLNYVVDLFVMGCALFVETSVLLNWCEDQGYGPLAITGLSLGGHMASLAATFVPKPVAVIACLASTTASPAFTKGVLSNAVAWSVLEKQLEDSAFFEELQHICHTVESDALKARNSDTTGLNIAIFPQELMSILNNTVMPLSTALDYNAQYSMQGYNMYDNCEAVSFEVVAKTLKQQLENNIKTKVTHNIPVLSSIYSHPKEPKNQTKKTRNFMTYLLDITTHLAYYRKPVDPSLAVFVQAELDGYIPKMDSPSPLELWPGCKVRYVDSGHIFAALYKQDVFRKIIAETLDRC